MIRKSLFAFSLSCKILILSLLLICSSRGMAQNADINLLRSINPTQPSSDFWKTASGSAFPVTIAVQGSLMAYDYLHSDSTRGLILQHVAEKLVVLAITEGIKLAINRPRPYTTYPGIIHPDDAREWGKSFPSAHTSVAFNTAATLSLRFDKWYITLPAYLWAGSVGYSRMYLGEHYPSDVLAGAAVGIGSAYLVRWLDRKLIQRKKRKQALKGL